MLLRFFFLLPAYWPPLAFRGVVAVLTLAAGLIGLRVAGDLEATATRYGPTRSVPVAARALPVGAVVRTGDVEERLVPARLVPRAAMARTWVGQTVIAPVVGGEVLVAARLAPAGLRGAAALVPRGARAVAVPAGPAGHPPLRIGDRVDVLATVAYESAGTDVPPTLVVATAALVVHVDDTTDVVTVAVPEADAPRVAHAVVTAAVTLALRT